MINITSQVQLLKSGSALHSACKKAIFRVTQIIDEQFNGHTRPPGRDKVSFHSLFGSKSSSKIKFDAEFIQAAFELSQQNQGAKGINILSRYATGAKPSAAGLPFLKRGLKLLLVELWRDGALLLPTTFNVGPSFNYGAFDHALLKWVRSFEANDQSGAADVRRMQNYGPRLVWAANWKRPSDVNLRDITQLGHARALHAAGKSDTETGGNQLPLGLFPAALLRAFPTEVAFSEEDLARYSQWTLSRKVSETPFEEFKKIGKPKKTRGQNKETSETEKKSRGENQFDSPNEPGIDGHEILLRNFKKLSRTPRGRLNWRTGLGFSYPGREHIELSKSAATWVKCFNAYLNHRKIIKGYRSDDEAIRSLNLLFDYLFYYLLWWQELFPATRVNFPTRPRDFARYIFVVRTDEVPCDQLPATLLTLIRLRRPKTDSGNVAIQQINLFFEFLETEFSEDEDIAGPSFRSPLEAKIDSPRGRKSNKTTKAIIPKSIYGYLLFYCYAVENFGVHLQKLARSGNLSNERAALSRVRRFDTAAFGYVPQLRYRDQTHPVVTVPNLFLWEERTVKDEDGLNERKVYMPHCTVLRLLITTLETGLRAQGVQWLDRTQWRSLMTADIPENSYTWPLLVNTDKTKTESFATVVVYRVKHLLAREEAFQLSFPDSDKFGPVEYEFLDNSPFDIIQPLFRSAASAGPVGDTMYDNYWRDLMVDFEFFYRAISGENHVKLFKLVPRMEDGAPVIHYTKSEPPRPYCAISTLAIHTPHACRATFATNRKGILDLSDAAELLGHSDIVTTARYDKPDEADLRERLKDSDLAIVRDFVQFERGSEVKIRADKPESALRRSFEADREGTLKAFRFMPSIAIWSIEDAGKKPDAGLQLLREGPMSRIRFRETHVCPVGEECPRDVLQQIGEPRRCGCCPIAMKCVDHLPAIAAKCNQLRERIRYQSRVLDALRDAGEPAAVLDEIWDAKELDVNELAGWELSEQILERMRAEPTPHEGDLQLYVQEPEIVKLHLQRVSRQSTVAEFMLQRIADSNAYPSMSTPQTRLAASQIQRRLRAGHGLDNLKFEDDGFGDVQSTSTALALMMKARGLSMSEVASRLTLDADKPLAVSGNDLQEPQIQP